MIKEILIGQDDLDRLYLLVTRLGNQSHCSWNWKKFVGSQADRKEREEVEAVNVAAQLKKTKISGLPTSLSILILENKPIYSQAA
ncbi:hypothetical protein Pyn_12399 [Prunus yedoensis var. nudiflora]|uniref:Uncharacterized protein n=1 Tax=Prunus yedoensis var. nudiflora TaxID=2094558 RepID=A0A314ZKT4_PRUYE|nr:hypothetical protein Pyn_12399 [Prunus yedoensis var. nudiflora]